MRSTPAAAICGAIILATGCSKPRVGGDPREVTILADERVWAAVESTFTAGIERKVLLLDEETVFWGHRLGADAWETVRRRPLIVFLAAVEEEGAVANTVTALTGKELVTLASASPFTRMVDPWARGQVAYVLVGHTLDALDSLTSRVTSRIYDDFYDRYRATVRERLYARGEDSGLRRDLVSRYGWSLSVPRPWGKEEDPEERWVHFVKTDPDRHVSVYWEDWVDTTMTAEYCLRRRRDLAWRHYDEDSIDETRTSYSWTTFQGRPAVEIAGAWTNVKYIAGGPFRTICFLAPHQRRFYLIDLVTFAPDRPKFYVMTQLGLIAETFALAGEGGEKNESGRPQPPLGGQ